MRRVRLPLRAVGIPTVVLAVVGFVLSSSGRARAAPPSSDVPRHEFTNVIFISIDTLRHDHLGCYGYGRETSKNIDGLAARSTVFDNFIVQAVLTPVSQMSIFTSQHPRVNGLTSFQVGDATVTDTNLPTILANYGYTNAAISSSPEFLPRNAASQRSYKASFFKSFDEFIPAREPGRRIPTEALQWLKDNQQKKFFLWVAIGTVHFPFSYAVPEPYKTVYDEPGYVPFFCTPCQLPGGDCTSQIGYGVLSRIYKNTFYVNAKPAHILSETDKRYIVGRYDAGIHYTDLFVGQLLALLDDLQLTDKTLVVLHSIHGEDLGEHGYFMHYDLYDTEVKNALIMKFPESRFKPKRIVAQVQGIDLAPTVLSYLGIPIHHEAQGRSALPLIKGEEGEVSEYAFMARLPLWEYLLQRRSFHFVRRDGCVDTPAETEALREFAGTLATQFQGFSPETPPYYAAVRTNEWKLIHKKDPELLARTSWWSFVSGTPIDVEEVELYDLRRDPHEQTNVAAEHPRVTERLRQKLAEWDQETEVRARARVRSDTPPVILPYPGVLGDETTGVPGRQPGGARPAGAPP